MKFFKHVNKDGIYQYGIYECGVEHKNFELMFGWNKLTAFYVKPEITAKRFDIIDGYYFSVCTLGVCIRAWIMW